MNFVIDASVLVDATFGSERAWSLVRAAHELHAPVTIDAEVLHALRRKWLAGIIHPELSENIYALLNHLHFTRHPVQPLVPRMWSLRQNLTSYDAAYVALAESLSMPLVTRDRRLARSAGHQARIDYID